MPPPPFPRVVLNSARTRALQEVEAYAELGDHECVVKHYMAWEEDGILFLQMEWCEQGSLKDYLETHGKLPEDQIWEFLIDIARGLKVQRQPRKAGGFC